MKDDDILCELQADIFSGASDDCETDKILGTHNFDGKGSERTIQVTNGQLTPQLPHLFFLSLNPFSKSCMLVTTANKQKLKGGFSKYGLGRNIFYRFLGQFIVQSKNCRFMKP